MKSKHKIQESQTKNLFKVPKAEVAMFSHQDVISTSGGGNDSDPDHKDDMD